MTGATSGTTDPTDTAASAVRLNTATVTQYLASQSAGLAPGKRRTVLLRAEPVWDGPSPLTWGDQRRAVVVGAPSPQAAYELGLAHQRPAATGPDVLVVLTDREEADLGPDLLAKVHRQRVNAVDTWDVVREAFGAMERDPRLERDNWAAEALLDATPPGGWPQLGGGILTRTTALTSLALRRLGIGRYDPDRDQGDSTGVSAESVSGGGDPGTEGTPEAVTGGDSLDAHALLRWSLTPGGPEPLLALRRPEREGLASFLGKDDRTGLAGQALIALVDAGHGPDAVAFGLVCAALWARPEAEAEDYRARGRAERWFGRSRPSAERHWARSRRHSDGAARSSSPASC